MQQHFRTSNFYILILMALFASVQSQAQQASRFRLMFNNDPSSEATIAWDSQGGEVEKYRVYYGPKDFGRNPLQYPVSTSPDAANSYKEMRNTFVRLKNLPPGEACYFVVSGNGFTSERFWFKTSPASPDQRLNLVAGGDSRNNRDVRRNANLLVSKLRPLAVFFGGDMTSIGSSSQWKEWFDDWQLSIAKDGRMFPLVVCRGNHEFSDEVIQNLFDTPKGVYYAMNFGGNLLRAYTLNTEISIKGTQTQWLKNDLQQHARQVHYRMVQYHKPMRPHVYRKVEGIDQYRYWAELFYKFRVDLAVECDAHTVKRTWPVKPRKKFSWLDVGRNQGFERDDLNGTVYVGEGCWGAPLRRNNDNKRWTRASGMFNQFKWIFVDRQKMEVRCVKVDNAPLVSSLTEDTLFDVPENLDIWKPENGETILINCRTNPDK